MKIIDSPREGMQSLARIIPAAEKIRYIDRLLRVGFDTVEVGSYVSPKVIPQMADSLEVLKQLDRRNVASNIMFLAVNGRGAEVLAPLEGITHLSFPFSFSPTFLKLNVKSTVEESFTTVRQVVGLCRRYGKEPVIYLSMAFGNPYGDPWNPELLAEWTGRLYDEGAYTQVLSNVSLEIGSDLIRDVYGTLIPRFPEVEFGLHLHTDNRGWKEKVEAAWDSGVRRFDGVMSGRGGCPMAGKEMLGNLRTENLVEFARTKGIPCGVDEAELEMVSREAGGLFE